MSFRLLTPLILSATLGAHAQSDFAHQIMSSGRYQVKKPGKSSPTKVRTPASATAASSVEVEGDEVKVEVKAAVEETKETAPPVGDAVPAGPTPAADVPDEAEPSLGEQARGLFGSDYGRIREFYKEQVHPDDPRLNRVEIQLLPGFTYHDSKSNYSYRSYHMGHGQVELQSNVWATPLLGLTGALRFSLGASMSGDSATNSMLPVKTESMDFGVKLRRFYGLSRKSSSVETSLLYNEATLNVPASSTDRSRLKSTGLGVGVLVKLPVSQHYTWALGGKLFPRLQHTETAGPVDLDSGHSNENVRLGLDLGGEFHLSRQSQFIYNFGWTVEKNLFDGPAAAVDAETGVTPSNVTVTNSILNFSFGYRWGH